MGYARFQSLLVEFCTSTFYGVFCRTSFCSTLDGERLTVIVGAGQRYRYAGSVVESGRLGGCKLKARTVPVNVYLNAVHIQMPCHLFVIVDVISVGIKNHISTRRIGCDGVDSWFEEDILQIVLGNVVTDNLVTNLLSQVFQVNTTIFNFFRTYTIRSRTFPVIIIKR